MIDAGRPLMRLVPFRKADRPITLALETPTEERSTFLARICAEDPELGAEVAELLRLVDEEGALLVEGGALVAELGVGFADDPKGSQPALTGKRVGPWRIVRELGRGGMAGVYLAERADGAYEQLVALKLLRARLQTAELVHRFERERQILASLQHPHIARLVDGGLTDEGRPWFAMEYVQGLAINRYCDRNRLSVDERLKLFIQVARAVQAAHRARVVHQDLKPSNILVTEGGEPRLLDFGIAKSLDQDAGVAPASQALLMLTPEYASPEQVRGDPVTPASDVYQLGLLLYELLTGERARRVESRSGRTPERLVTERTPLPPSTAVRIGEAAAARAEARQSAVPELARRLRGDLDAIVLRALRRGPERRYGSATEMAEDVRRHLAALPVTARPDALSYRAHKFVLRHALGVATTAGILMFVATLLQSPRGNEP